MLPFFGPFQGYSIEDEHVPWIICGKTLISTPSLITPNTWLPLLTALSRGTIMELLQLQNQVIPICSMNTMFLNQLNPVAKFLIQPSFGHIHAFPQNCLLFSPDLQIFSLQSSSMTRRKNLPSCIARKNNQDFKWALVQEDILTDLEEGIIEPSWAILKIQP